MTPLPNTDLLLDLLPAARVLARRRKDARARRLDAAALERLLDPPAQLALKVSVAYGEPTDKVIGVLKQAAQDVRNDPQFAEDMVADPEVPGIDRVAPGEAEYLVLMKTRPGRQYRISRELRRRASGSSRPR